jgi:hypothetical protein
LEQLLLVELVTLAQLVTMVLWEAPHHLAHYYMVMAAVEEQVAGLMLEVVEVEEQEEH